MDEPNEGATVTDENMVPAAELEKANNNYNSILGRYKQAESKINELTSMVTELKDKADKASVDETKSVIIPHALQARRRCLDRVSTRTCARSGMTFSLRCRPRKTWLPARKSVR